MADQLPEPTSTSWIASSASRPERFEHRLWIGGAITTLLGFYWQDTRRASMIEDEVLAAWIEDLEGFPREAIESAIRRWRREEERRPTPAGLRRLCREEMPKPRIVRNAPEPPRERVTPEAAREILAQTGWSQRLIKRMPRSGEE